ncbi:hypothetical protein [Aquipseudomonas campi]
MLHAISNAGSKESDHYRAIDLDERRERAMEALKAQILAEVDSGEPAACNAFADHCATWVDRDLSYALVAARIHSDAGLLQSALDELDAHIKNTRDEFASEEAEKRIAALQKKAEAGVYAMFPGVASNE